jgi:hypothetical protein
VHVALEDVAERLLEEARVGLPTPDTALALLAADALITFACVALAETAPQELSELS